MKTLTAFVLVLVAHCSFGQLPNYLENYIEEKFRDERIREFVRNHALAYQEAKANGVEYVPEGPSAIDFLNSLEISNTETKGINFTFSPAGAEPHIAINPTNSDHVVVTYMSGGGSLNFPIFVSMDGGNTWTQSSYDAQAQLDNHASGASVAGGGDPILAFDDDGNLHLTYIFAYTSGFNILGAMFYVNSTDGGLSFNIPPNGAHLIYEGNVFAGDLLDRQWMHCDNTGGAEDGTLYMSAVYFGGGFGTAGQLVLKKGVADDGFTSNTVAVPHTGGLSTQFGNLKTDNNGDVHMACMRFDGGTGAGEIVYTKSTDAASTFTPYTVIANATTGLPNNAPTHIVHDRDNSATSLAVDGNNVYIAWSDFTGGTMRGFFTYSSDGGVNFATPYEFGPAIFGSGFLHAMPNIAADNGRVSVTWYKVDSTTFETEYVMAESDNAGQSFDSYAIISAGTTDFQNETPGDFYGDYNASEKDNCNTYSVFCDGRTGSPVVYFVNEDACSLGVGVEEITAINGTLNLALYPNPTQDMLNIEVSSETPSSGEISIINVDGRVVKVQELNTNSQLQKVEINVSELASGVYRLRVETDKEYIQRSFVKK